MLFSLMELCTLRQLPTHSDQLVARTGKGAQSAEDGSLVNAAADRIRSYSEGITARSLTPLQQHR